MLQTAMDIQKQFSDSSPSANNKKDDISDTYDNDDQQDDFEDVAIVRITFSLEKYLRNHQMAEYFLNPDYPDYLNQETGKNTNNLVHYLYSDDMYDDLDTINFEENNGARWLEMSYYRRISRLGYDTCYDDNLDCWYELD